MGEAVINNQMKEVKLKGGVKWGVELVPTNASIQKMKFQASAHSDSTVFSTKLENDNLVIYFGDPASHTGNFVFAHNCGGTLAKQFAWNVSVFLSVLSLPGDKTLKISDQGLAEITVDSGLAVYSYKFLSQSK